MIDEARKTSQTFLTLAAAILGGRRSIPHRSDKHDGASAHFSVDARAQLTVEYREHWIGRRGLVAWPALSPDLAPLDFFSEVCQEYGLRNFHATRAHLIDRTNAAFHNVKQNPTMLSRVGRSLLRGYKACNEAHARLFEHLCDNMSFNKMRIPNLSGPVDNNDVTLQQNRNNTSCLFHPKTASAHIVTRRVGHVARMGKSRNAYRLLVGRREGRKSLEIPRRRWEDNIKMDLRKVGCDARDWINLAQKRTHGELIMYQLVPSDTGCMDGTAPLSHRHNNIDECECPKTTFTKLEQRSCIKIDMARDRSAHECFQGLREAPPPSSSAQEKTTTLGGTEPIILHDNARSHTAAALKDLLRR
ncbi:hypothetical protein ANN_11610 [Periplaneta americana]|uniref:Tc1-like transposase DDE domain-containing protein n=1 Tax=Periplaneta americana TaxID=6978 RepID=A0ABQ8T782_PERAM|nr:hypothetical protein ANN_11610 [Periplaneta americana]